MGRRIETDANFPIGRRIEAISMLPNEPKIEIDACYPMSEE
jgi:hypothetical protein